MWAQWPSASNPLKGCDIRGQLGKLRFVRCRKSSSGGRQSGRCQTAASATAAAPGRFPSPSPPRKTTVFRPAETCAGVDRGLVSASLPPSSHVHMCQPPHVPALALGGSGSASPYCTGLVPASGSPQLTAQQKIYNLIHCCPKVSQGIFHHPSMKQLFTKSSSDSIFTMQFCRRLTRPKCLERAAATTRQRQVHLLSKHQHITQ